MCVCVCVCVCERERERERKRGGGGERMRAETVDDPLPYIIANACNLPIYSRFVGKNRMNS